MTEKTKKTKKNKNKPLSLAEFRAWLSGVEDLHPNDWHPSAEQWKLIRDKISCIEETATVTPAQPLQFEQPRGRMPVVDPVYVPAPSMLAPAVPPVEAVMSPEALRLMAADGVSKTPNVDSSSGHYTSSFS